MLDFARINFVVFAFAAYITFKLSPLKSMIPGALKGRVRTKFIGSGED